jgi:hypothetical protein
MVAAANICLSQDCILGLMDMAAVAGIALKLDYIPGLEDIGAEDSGMCLLLDRKLCFAGSFSTYYKASYNKDK